MRETVISLLENMMLLLATSVLSVIVPTKYLVSGKTITKKRLISQILGGLVVGTIGVAVILQPIMLAEGILIDVRSILIGVSALIFGPVTTIIAAVIIAGFRLIQGGVAMYAGAAYVVVIAVVGMIWRHKRLNKLITNKRTRWLELYIYGLVIHIITISSTFMIPPEPAALVWKNASIPIMTFLPIGTVLIGLILFSQIDNSNTFNKLEKSENRLRTTLMSVGDGIIAADKSGRITLMNSVAENITGASFDKAKGKPIENFYEVRNIKTNEELKNPVTEVLSTGKAFDSTNNATLIRKDGCEISISSSATPITDTSGKITGAILTLRDTTEERKHLERINYLAFHDVMTGLYNRRFFDEEAKRLDVARNLPISVIIGDVNGLKLTNDAFGHDAGDKFLIDMAAALKKACRKEDIIARWGGDEFIILLPKTDSETAYDVCKRIRESCSHVSVSGIEFSISLGFDTKVSEYISMSEIIKTAEDYMYRKKSTESPLIRSSAIRTILDALHKRNIAEQSHSNRVSMLSKEIGVAMNLSDKEVSELELAGRMHDIGKIAIPNDTLVKKDTLSTDERAEIMRHSEIGFRILSASNNMSYIAEYVLCHHERPDGTGYPFGITKEKIPLQSRILAVADAYDAMTSHRSYKDHISEHAAVAELKRCSGAQFDEEIVDVFIEKVLHRWK